MTNIEVRREGSFYVADWGFGPRRCAVGRGGVAQKLREGDGVTPIGVWPLRRVFYRPDRLKLPHTSLQIATIAHDDGWCDAPDDAHYNAQVKLPYPASAECFWREDRLYDLIVVVGFNDMPVFPGKGSAIFIHVAYPDYAPTEGCVALARDDLLEALEQLTPDSVLRLRG